jgi:GDPmannose 4,6-dehydratase
MAFKAADITLDWKGSAEQEQAIDTKTGKALVKIAITLPSISLLM